MADELVQAMLGFGAVIRPYMTKEIAGVVAAAGLSERDLQILEYVGKRGTTTFGDIAEQLQVDARPGTSTSRLSSAVAALFGKHGVIKKEVNPDDQRQTNITLTAKGRRLLERVSEVRTRVYEAIGDAMELNQADAKKMKEVFRRGTSNFEQFLGTK